MVLYLKSLFFVLYFNKENDFYLSRRLFTVKGSCLFYKVCIHFMYKADEKYLNFIQFSIGFLDNISFEQFTND